MTAYENAVFDDLCQRKANGEAFTPLEQRRYNTLDRQAREEWENEPEPKWYGGHPDMF